MKISVLAGGHICIAVNGRDLAIFSAAVADTSDRSKLCTIAWTVAFG